MLLLCLSFNNFVGLMLLLGFLPVTVGWLTGSIVGGYPHHHHHRSVVVVVQTCVSLKSGRPLYAGDDDRNSDSEESSSRSSKSNNRNKEARPFYDLGIGKNKPIGSDDDDGSDDTKDTDSSNIWVGAELEPVRKPLTPTQAASVVATAQHSLIPNNANKRNVNENSASTKFTKTRRMVARDNEAQRLRAALWDEMHFSNQAATPSSVPHENHYYSNPALPQQSYGFQSPPRPTAIYPDIDLSIPDSVYSKDGSVDLVWDLLRWEAFQQAQREPLLVSFLHSTILNHESLESSLAFLLANRLQSAGFISTQLQSLIQDSLRHSPTFRRSLRADMMAVRDRDPACNYLPDVFLYFKGFHALQTHRVAHYLWNTANSKKVMAKFLQSQVSQIFQIDIHPNAVLGSGIMLDHGTGIVIGETATVGHNCSILHHVTLGGSGKTGVKRHPSVGDGVLLGAGATVLGPVTIGEGTQIGAGTLVISDLPPHSVAVGVPARVIGSFIDVTKQPSIGMDQMISPKNIITFESEGI